MEQKNVVLALVLSAIVIIGWSLLQPMLFPLPPAPPPQQQTPPAQTQTPPATATPGTATPGAATVPGAIEAAPAQVDRKTALAQSPRVVIESAKLKGSIALKGGRIDDVELVEYHETVDPKSPNIVLLSPSGAADAYFAEFGWCRAPDCKPGVDFPDKDTIWQADGDKLTPEKPLTLTWHNGQGVRFSRTFSLDTDFMFTVTQQVENGSGAPIKLYPYGRIQRMGTPAVGITRILQEGPIGAFGNVGGDAKYRLSYRQYHKMPEDYAQPDYVNPGGPLRAPDGCHVDDSFKSTGGWLGINDKYWLVALVPDHAQPLDACFRWQSVNKTDSYQLDYRGAEMEVAPSATVATTGSLFVGAKQVSLLDEYGDNFAGVGIPLFDRAVDFSGYFPGYSLAIIAKPLFKLLDLIYRFVGNFGIAIMVLTVLVKTVFFPLANKSYRAMNKMKKLAPQMQELRTRLGDDKVRLNQEMMALYKREKVNPAAGCLPLVVQIPVFIALYQVLYVTIEMRHAPFFGWIRDLSAPDPTSVLNLFGLLPYHVPDLGMLHILSIGVWPLVMGVTMFLQQKMNPPPPDPVQAKIFMFLPIMFTFMLAPFAAGLVIYWSWNNLLSIAQQWLLKRLDERRDRQGPKPPEQKVEKQPEQKPEKRPEQKREKRLEHKSGRRN
jgi:YidC/Oxa1 family membrane protein insertase